MLAPLALGDRPRTGANGHGFRIRDKKVPPEYVISSKPVGEGAHNAAYKATHPGIRGEVLFRVNTDVPETREQEEDMDREIAGEVARSIEFATLGIAPLLYDYGYCPPTRDNDGYFWQVMELYDESLHAYLEREGRQACAETHRIEEMVLDKLSVMVQARSFCYDIHPRNVVVKKDAKGRIAKVALIDFDDSFCIRKSRINPPDAARRSHHRPTYRVSPNNLLVSALIVFGSNSREQCGVPLFRDKVLGLLRGDRTYAIEGGGPVDMATVLNYLGTSTAQGTHSTLGLLRHWNTRYGLDAAPETFVQHVLGGPAFAHFGRHHDRYSHHDRHSSHGRFHGGRSSRRTSRFQRRRSRR